MFKYLNIAILLVCFYDAIILMLIPSSATFLLAGDGMAASMICILTAMAIGLWVLLSQGFKPFKNKWSMVLLLFIAFSSFHSPNIKFVAEFVPKDAGLFNFKPLFEIMVYAFLLAGIASLPYSGAMKGRVGFTFAWVGLIYSAYVIIQHLGMDQFYRLNTAEMDISNMSRNPQDGGFISQPVYAAALIAICMPFILRYFKWWALVAIVAVLLTSNRSALVAIAISGIYFLSANRRVVLWVLGAYIAVLGLVMAIYWAHPSFNFHVEPYGRLMTWKAVLLDILHPNFPGVHKSYILTGLGIGSFSILFPFYHQSGFYQVHNEYLEVVYCLSLIGLGLLLKSLWQVFKISTDRTLTSALLAICVFAITNPVWHIPQLQFLTIFLIGMIYNKENTYGMA